MSAGIPSEKAIADRVLAWLTATDDWGNQHAMLRRLGIKYMIWNRQIWSTNTKAWQPYSCNPNASTDSCHIYHVHFSFAWPGARKQTSWWTGPKIDGPVVVARGNRVDVLVRGTDGGIFQKTYDPETGRWSPNWYSLGGFATAGPAAAWWNDQFHVFVRGGDNMVYQRIWSPGSGWGAWARRFGPVESQPVATTYNGTIHVLAKDRNTDQTMHWFWTGSIWQPENLGGGSRSGPGATQFGNQFQVAVRGTNDEVWHRFYDGRWSVWTSLRGGTYSKPEVATAVDGFHVFVRGTDGRLYQRAFAHGTGWTDWTRVDPAVIRSAPSSAVTSSGYPHVAAYNAAGNVVIGSFFGSAFSGFGINLGGATA